MSTLRKVIKEEMSNILQKADEIDLSDRERKDRMKKAGSEREEQWYETKAKNERQVREKVRDLVSEEYETLREEPETSINHRSGLRSPDEINSSKNRWFDQNDAEKIEEAAKKVAKKVLQEEVPTTTSGALETAQDLRRSLNTLAADKGSKNLEEAAERLRGVIQRIREEQSSGGSRTITPQVRNPR